MPSLVEIGPVVYEKKMNCEKYIDRRTDGWADGRRTLGDQKSSLEIKRNETFYTVKVTPTCIRS